MNVPTQLLSPITIFLKHTTDTLLVEIFSDTGVRA